MMGLELAPEAALALLIPAVPVSLWAAWSDLAHMKIYNRAVLALIVGFLLVAPWVMPIEAIGWRLVQFAVVLAIGFVLSMIGMMGGGDAKFAAAMALYVEPGDASFFMLTLAILMPLSLVLHRLIGVIPGVRHALAGMTSFRESRRFPMALPMGGTLVLYLLLAAIG